MYVQFDVPIPMPSTPTLDFFLCKMSELVASTEALCMCIIATHMSMTAIRIGIAEATVELVSDLGCRGVCRGMLQGSSRPDAGEVRGTAVAGGSGEPVGEDGSSGRRGCTGVGAAGGPSRTGDGRRRLWESRDGRPDTSSD